MATESKFSAISKLKVSDNKYVSGREVEINIIRKFIKCHSERGGALLIFGPCGSGKTVCMQHIFSLNLVPDSYYVICYTFTKISDLFKTLFSIVSGNKSHRHLKSSGDFTKDLREWLSYFRILVSKLTHPVLLVLDEIDAIDQLCGTQTRSRDLIIQEIFSIVCNTGKLILIAISNNLELASYICGSKFSRLPFKPYTEDQLLSDDQVINKTALKVVVRRIVNTNGDCRKCLDIFSRSIAEFMYMDSKSSSDLDKSSQNDTSTDSEEFVTPKRCRPYSQDSSSGSYELTSKTEQNREFDSGIEIRDICETTPTLSIGSREKFDMKIQSIPTIHQIVLYSLVQLALAEYMEEIPVDVVSISAKHVINELQLNESYELSVETSLEHLESIGLIENKNGFVVLKPSVNSLVSSFNNIELFRNLEVSKISYDVSNKRRKTVSLKKCFPRRG